MSDHDSWFRENWDKILTAIISIAVSGVTGFFSAVLLLKNDMYLIKEKVAKLEVKMDDFYPTNDAIELTRNFEILKTRMNDVVIPSLRMLDDQRQRISTLEITVFRIDERSAIIQKQSETLLNHQINKSP